MFREPAIIIDADDDGGSQVIIPRSMAAILAPEESIGSDVVLPIFPHAAEVLADAIHNGSPRTLNAVGPRHASVTIDNAGDMKWDLYGDDSGWTYFKDTAERHRTANAVRAIATGREILSEPDATDDAIRTLMALAGHQVRIGTVHIADPQDWDDDNDFVYRYALDR